MLDAVKRALRLTTDVYDAELQELIAAALLDLGIAGVTEYETDDPLVLNAVKTYCRMHFGSPDDYDRLAAAYDTQKGQLQIATGYTDWGEDA